MAVSGMIMQMLTRNRFAEPSTAGTGISQSWHPSGHIARTGNACNRKNAGRFCYGAAGTALFLRILRAIPLRSVLVVPLVGIMLGGVVRAITTFIAYRFDLLQSLNSWTTGDFSGVLRDAMNSVACVLPVTIIAYIAADRFTVADWARISPPTLA